MVLPRRHVDTTPPALAASSGAPGSPQFAQAWTEFLTELRTSVAETLNGITLRGARPVAVGLSPGATMRPTTSAGAIVGFALRNTSTDTTSNTVIYLYNGADANADVLLSVTLAPGESTRDWFGPAGIHVGDQGLYIVGTGTFDGSLFMRGVEL